MTKDKFIISGCFSQAYNVGLLDAFIKKGNTITTIGTDYSHLISDSNKITFIDFRKNYKPARTKFEKLFDIPFYYVRILWASLNAKQKNILNVFAGRPFIEGILLQGLLKLAGKRIFLIVHNILPHDRATPLNVFFHYFIYHLTSDKFIVHAPHLKLRLIKEFKVAPDKIVYAPLGIYDVVSSLEINRDKARSSLHIAKNKYVVLSFGVQLPYKGTHLLLDILDDQINSENLYILICGKAKNGYDDFLLNIIKNKYLQSRTSCVFGFIPENDVQLYFKAADVVALPYLEDSQSAVMFTAYSFGRPVLASNIGSFSDYIESGKTGEIFNCGDTESLKSKINHMKTDKSNYQEKYIKESTRTKYSWEKCAEAISTLYL